MLCSTSQSLSIVLTALLFILGTHHTPTMRRPVFGAGSWGEATHKASLASYEAFVGLKFLTDASGRRVESRKLYKYIIGNREVLIFPGNPLGNKSKASAEMFPRLDWDKFVVRLDSNNLWKRFYRMSKSSFMELLELLRPDLEKNQTKGSCSTTAGTISPELRLSITLRWLAGASYQDIAIIHGVHNGSVYAVVNSGISSLDALPALNLKFPLGNTEELSKIAATFSRKAAHTVFPSVVGALDGILITCCCPNRKKCKNPATFWTRKGKYAWNVQAICDGERDFLYMSVMCPGDVFLLYSVHFFLSFTCVCFDPTFFSSGSTHDSHAWRLTSLAQALRAQKLPAPFHLIADRFFFI